MLLAVEGIAGAGKSTLRDQVLAAAASEQIPLDHIGQFSWLSLPATRTLIEVRAGRAPSSAGLAGDAAHEDLELHLRYNLAPALRHRSVIADRLTLSTVCLLALVDGRPVHGYIHRLAQVTAARPEFTLLLTTPLPLCQARLDRRPTRRRFGEDAVNAARIADLYEQAATTWTDVTGLPVIRQPCATDEDLVNLATLCLDQLRGAQSGATWTGSRSCA